MLTFEEFCRLEAKVGESVQTLESLGLAVSEVVEKFSDLQSLVLALQSRVEFLEERAAVLEDKVAAVEELEADTIKVDLGIHFA